MYVKRLLAACLLLGTLLLVLSFATGDASASDEISQDAIHVPYATDRANDKWTVMVYMDADNNLEPYGILDFYELASVGSSSDVNLLVQFDRTSGYDSTNGDWTDCLRFCVNSSETPTQANAVVDLGEVNMGSASTLSDFIIWGMTNYPADHYVLVLWDHGGGWYGVCWDDTSDDDQLTMAELGTAMDTVNATFPNFTLDILGLDACVMAEADVYHQFGEHADYIVGSVINVPGYGWNYELPFARLVAEPLMNASTLATYIADDFIDSYSYGGAYYESDATMSVVNVTAMEELMASLDALSDEMLAQMAYQHNYYGHCRGLSPDFDVISSYDMVDLLDLTEYLSTYGPTSSIRSLASQANEDVRACIVFSAFYDAAGDVDPSDTNGLGIYFPISSSYSYVSTYRSVGLDFTADYSWDEMLVSYLAVIGSSNSVVSISSFSPSEEINATVAYDPTLSVNVSDADNDVITYQWYVDDVLVVPFGTSSYTLETSGLTAGQEVAVKVKVWDGASWDEQSWTVTIVTLTQPNLVLTDITLADGCGDEVSDVTSGHPSYASITLTNTGTAISTTFRVYMFLDGSTFCYWEFSSFAAGRTTELISLDFSFSDAGSHNITFLADYNGTVTEENETDNAGYIEFGVVPAKYTVLIYMDGDNNLELYQVVNFLELASVGSSAEVTILVQFDRISGYDSSYGDWTGCYRFYIYKGITPVTSSAVMDVGEVDMGDDLVLEDFLLWGVDNYAADDYIVVLKDHGGAWKGCCQDFTSSYNLLDLQEMRYALSSMVNETGEPISIMLMDDCLMGAIEVAAELNGLASYAVVSETIGWTNNYEYDEIMTYLEGNWGNDAGSIATDICEMLTIVDDVTWSTQCVAAYDLTLTGTMLSAFEAYVDDLYACWSSDPSGLMDARTDCISFMAYYENDTVDLYQLVYLTMLAYQDDDLNASGQALLSLLDPASPSPFVMSCRATDTMNLCHGVSIYFPVDDDQYYSGYGYHMLFDDGSDWDEMLSAYLDDSPPQTTIYVNGEAVSNGWYTSPVEISFSVYDPSSLGIAYLNYSVNNGTWTSNGDASGASFTLSADGVYFISYFATGNNSAVEEVRNITVRIDTTAPEVEAHVDDMTVTLNATDATSGPQSIYYKIDDGSWTLYSSPFVVDDDGYEHVVSFYAVDVAGILCEAENVTVGDNDLPPETTIVLSGTAGSNGWYTSTVSVSFTVDDIYGEGYRYLNYSVDGGAWTAYTGSFGLTSDGTHYVRFYATGQNWEVEAVRNVTVKIDRTAPSASAVVNGMTVTLSASDVTSGVSALHYRIDGGSWLTYTSPIVIEVDGFEHEVSYYATDVAGNSGVTKLVVIGEDDIIAPETTVDVDGTLGNDGWYISDVSVTLSAEDQGGSGMGTIYYRIDGGDWTVCSGALFFNVTGTFVLEHYAVDNFGNEEIVGALTIKVDVNAPDASATFVGSGDECFNGTVTVTFDGDDEGSGLSVMQYRVDGGAWANATSFELTGEGTFLIEVRAVDVAGNVGDIEQRTVVIDLTAPTSSITTEGDEDGWSNDTVTVTIAGEDSGPADLHLQYKVNGGDWTAYSSPIVFDDDGTYEVVCRAVDTAGNVGAMANVSFVIDIVAPSSFITAEGITHEGSYVNSVEIVIYADDEGSGTEATYYKLDNGTWTLLSGPLSITSVGDHSLSFYSVDVLGNVEDASIFNFTVMSATVPGNVTDLVLTIDSDPTEGYLNWSSPSDGGLEITYYLIYRAAVGEEYEVIANVTTNNYTDSNLSEGTEYGYYVIAGNALGEGISSNVARGTTADEGTGVFGSLSTEMLVTIGALVIVVIIGAAMMIRKRK